MKNTKVAVVFHSATGTTAQLAESIQEGIRSVEGVIPTPVKIEGSDILEGRYKNLSALDLVTEADGVIFGSPTFMGNVSAEFKSFADASSDLWTHQQWCGKIASAFTIGSNLSGDQLCTLQYLQIFAAQHGMLWAGLDICGGYDAKGRNRLGAHSGLIAHTTETRVHAKDLETAHYLGSRIANLVSSRKPSVNAEI